MKNTILLVFLAVAYGGYSQNYYQDGTTVSADGIVYKVKLSEASFMLSNTADFRGSTPFYYQDGRELETLDEYAMIDAKSNNLDSQALREALGDEVIASLRSYKYSPMVIFYVVGPDGTTLEVAFIMKPVPELLSLKPEVFADLERKLKKYVKWEVSELGRKVKYFHMTGFIGFRKVPLSSELPFVKQIDSLPVMEVIQ